MRHSRPHVNAHAQSPFSGDICVSRAVPITHIHLIFIYLLCCTILMALFTTATEASTTTLQTTSNLLTSPSKATLSVASVTTSTMAQAQVAVQVDTSDATNAAASQVEQTSEQDPIVLAVFIDPNTNVEAKWVELIYQTAFARLGRKVQLLVVPAARASLMADAGKVDGEAGRVANYGEQHPNLIRVEEPILAGDLAVFATTAQPHIREWSDLDDTELRVEYYRGIFLADQKLHEHIRPENLSDSSNPVNSLRKLLRNRIDLYIDSSFIINPLLITPEFIGQPIAQIATLETTINFGFLHKRHKALATQLAIELRHLKQEGQMASLLSQAQALVAHPKP